MKQFLFSTALLLTMSLLPGGAAQAQPGSGGPTPGPVAPTETPLDGGASLLLASGIALGVRKLRQRRKQAN
ncbi:PID-CTERM protein-sorting domain-containing protein [Hymenobacter siberiensis]|jgi:hypothetical protein|uniref:PID-CTERM protein-sorting domain-containing protein n=1 Tax=Hymenobacter siberiensis TaxID=2848396 RepID=UPI001C1E8716|nr:hypothetical protein [Hymenobacter siberiensis]